MPYPLIFESSSSAMSLYLAIFIHGLVLSDSLRGTWSGLYTMPVLTSTKALTPRLAASVAATTESWSDRSL